MCHQICIALTLYIILLRITSLCLQLHHRQPPSQLPNLSPPFPRISPAVAPLGPPLVLRSFRPQNNERASFASVSYSTYNRSNDKNTERNDTASAYTSNAATSQEVRMQNIFFLCSFWRRGLFQQQSGKNGRSVRRFPNYCTRRG
jgi:hypothetical protein